MTLEVSVNKSYSKLDGTVVTIGHCENLSPTSGIKIFKESATSSERWFVGGGPADGRIDPTRSLIAEVHPAIAAKVRAYDAAMKPAASAASAAAAKQAALQKLAEATAAVQSLA